MRNEALLQKMGEAKTKKETKKRGDDNRGIARSREGCQLKKEKEREREREKRTTSHCYMVMFTCVLSTFLRGRPLLSLSLSPSHPSLELYSLFAIYKFVMHAF